jgi:transposase
MFQVEIYGRVRRAVLVEGRSRRAVAREFGISRKTVDKMLRYSVPPGYQRQQPARRPKLGPWLGVIDAILKDDKTRPAKQRHTAKRIFERLKEEHGFSGGYTIVKDYVRGEQLRGREMFVPLVHPPGEAQADFGEALVVIAGVEQKAHFLAMDCPHSDDGFVAAFPGETTEAFQHGHVLAFQYFGAVPTRILYDNTKIAVAKILGGEERTKTKAFLELQSHYLFADKFGRPGKGNDKGDVEGLVGYARRNFMVPIPSANSWDELNAYLHPSDEDLSPGTPVWPGSAVNGVSDCCVDTRRRSASASNATGRRCCRCLLLPTKPAKRSLRGSVRCRWFVIAPTITLCPPSMGIVRCW